MSSVAMNLVYSEERSCLPSRLLYADDLVLMAPTMDAFRRRLAEWIVSILGKGLKVNASKSQVMVFISGGEISVHSGKGLVVS